jgi:N-acyl-D-amino-acid deacylase
MFDLVITGGRIIDGTGHPRYRADLGIQGDCISAIGRLGDIETKQRLDATGKIVAPGFIDAHVHGDLMLLADPLHEPAIRQGVTTYIIGQDGSSVAPASPAMLDYMRRYTAGFNGNPELRELLAADRPVDVAAYLALFDQRVALNVAYLIPNGNLRLETLGLETRQPTADELGRMRRLVRAGMEQGAVGLSSGLDYIPSRYAEEAELTALCQEMSSFSGVYVTHMRRYDPEGLYESMDEVYRIGRNADVGVHISHFNSQAELALPKVDAGRMDGVDVTYDLYCYLAGSSILGMVALPPWIQEGGIEPTLARLKDRSSRRQLDEWFKAPARGPLHDVRLSHTEAPEFRQHEGRTLQEAAAAHGSSLGEFVCDVLSASGMAVGCIAPHRRRGEADVQALMRHPAMMAGSDGIFIGSRPHPRGWGCFAKYLGHYVRDTKNWTLEEAVARCSLHAARRFGLKDRGELREGLAADVVVFDAAGITDRATYENGRQPAQGVDHVVVNGQLVLHDGKRTAALPGRGLRRG